MGNINEKDIETLLKDEKLLGEIVAQATKDPEIVDKLAAEVADKLSDYLEDDPNFKKKILDVAMKNGSFKEAIVKELLQKLG